MLKYRSPRAGLTRRKLVLGLAGGTTLLASTIPKKAFPIDRPKSKATLARPWLTLPDTPTLPTVSEQGLVKLSDGASVFFAQFGKGPSVLLLHGGLANSSYWGHQLTALSSNFTMTVMDTRGHGRSPLSGGSFSYRQFASDVVELLAYLNIPRTTVVGWSDGAITGIQLAMTKPDMMSGLFAFGANTTPDGLKAGGARTKVFEQFSSRCRNEYLLLSAHPERWPVLQRDLVAMWRTQPNFSKQQLAAIKMPVTVADGEYDEIIKPEHTRQIAANIPYARLTIMSDVSHFAMLQDPPQFDAALGEFLLKII